MPPHDAVAARSWVARSFLGLSGLVAGATTDAVIHDQDPWLGLNCLDHPIATVLRGQLAPR